jgi:dephospho-CoA kinase
VFQQPLARAKLEAILHPRIKAEMQKRIEQADSPYVILVIPLLLETGQSDLADRILVVDAPETLQIDRVRERDGQSEQQAQAILRAQVSRAQRLAAADDVLDNSGKLDQLIQQTDKLHQQYLALSQQAATPARRQSGKNR